MSYDRKRVGVAVLAVWLVALGVMAVAQMGSVEAEMTHDSAHYLELARAISRGDGYETQTQWSLNVDVEETTRPDTYRAPLLPFLIAATNIVFGDSFTGAKWASVLVGTTIPVLVLLIAHRRFGISLPIAVIAGVITALHHHLIVSAVRPLTETLFTATILTAIYFLYGSKPRPLVAGIFTGLAWLARYQALLVLPLALLAYVGKGGGRQASVRRVSLYLAGFLIAAGPWMARNTIVAGSPTYTDLRYHVISTHDPDRTPYHYFHGVEPAPEPVDYMLQNPKQTFDHVVIGLKKTARLFPKENAGNMVFMIAGLVGLIIWCTRWREQWRMIAGLAFFAASNIFLVCLAFYDDRHMTSLDPWVIVFVAVAIGALWRAAPGIWVRAGTVAIIGCALAWEVKVAVDTIRPYRPQYFEFAEATRDFLTANLEEGDAVMGEKPYYLSWVLDAPAVSLPWCADDELFQLAKRYDVRYACLGGLNVEHFGPAYPGSFIATGILPTWLQPVFRTEDPPVVVYELMIDDTPLGNGDTTAQAEAGGRADPYERDRAGAQAVRAVAGR